MAMSAKERILETADKLFYRDGFHAVGVDTVVAEAGVAKMTLYRHFPSKDHLIAAYLERANRQFWEWLEGAVRGIDDPEGQLVGMFEAIEELTSSPNCLGCTFQGTAAEFPDRDHLGHRIAIDHKRRVRERFAGLGRAAGLSNPDRLADELLLLMDGGWVAARMFGPDNPARGSLTNAARAMIRTHSPSDPTPATRPGA